MKYYAPRHNLIEDVVSILEPSQKVTKLSIVQYLRCVVAAPDNNMVLNHIVRHDLLRPVLGLLWSARRSRKDDLLSSTVLEMINFCCERAGHDSRQVYTREACSDFANKETYASIRNHLIETIHKDDSGGGLPRVDSVASASTDPCNAGLGDVVLTLPSHRARWSATYGDSDLVGSSLLDPPALLHQLVSPRSLGRVTDSLRWLRVGFMVGFLQRKLHLRLVAMYLCMKTKVEAGCRTLPHHLQTLIRAILFWLWLMDNRRGASQAII